MAPLARLHFSFKYNKLYEIKLIPRSHLKEAIREKTSHKKRKLSLKRGDIFIFYGDTLQPFKSFSPFLIKNKPQIGTE